MPAMGTEGKISTQLFLTLRAGRFFGIACGVLFLGLLALFGVVQGFRFVVGFFEALDGLADAVRQLWQAFGAEQQKHNN